MNDRQRTIHLPIFGEDFEGIPELEAELQQIEARERARLGLEEEAVEYWSDRMIDSTIKKSEIAETTLLIGGLPRLADIFIQSALEPLGYSVQYLPEPDHESMRFGKEFGNRGQCNPTYYTVGNLVRFLSELRDRGMTEEEIVRKYAFISAGSCGPCRFGMYVTEYRKALRDAGFEGFRIMLFEEKGGISQETDEEAGIDFSPRFFVQLGKAVYAADILNGVGYRLRPYEVEPGTFQAALEEAKEMVCEALQKEQSILWALRKARNRLGEVPIDRTKVKPKVAMMGEFWAQMTEGEGNYRVKQFLEGEGAEVKIQFVSEWLLYNVWEEMRDLELRVGLPEHDVGTARSLEHMGTFGVAKRRVGLWAFDLGMRLVFHAFARAAGFNDHQLTDVDASRVLAEDYYSSELRGGEGHMEVAHLLENYAHKRANMTLSVKPFGCLPSSAVSDGVLSKVLERYPGAVLASIETSGDGAVNFYSRVQLYLFKAKQQAQAEVDAALAETGLTMDEVRVYLEAHPGLDDPFHLPPNRAACTAANVVYQVHEHMQSTLVSRTAARVRGWGGDAVAASRRAVAAGPRAWSIARQLAGELAVSAGEAARARLGLAS